ncbi:antibiotic biosynthesis monooxygenase family protein [Streptomyces griseus]|uniref:antibiotic biosynthesis monooxygenase family protein n=1 Tax=Streptomyces TaxID=1883 RepID=UPI0001C187E3|nr:MULTISPECIES: antibiotic biosynthesis monooxygenase family protein [unclassified Streptomyces]EGE43785.1 Antibiotic biosynthesis monooxygenase [Streptomyces sp. ACT-1]MYR51822.1 antibiotic biosynthesis monooxygenase [Streptomyces sp. SID4928]SCD67410.1 Heme-degrading monooxygenase HmoA [Streptomyces sp. OspMP-M43]
MTAENGLTAGTPGSPVTFINVFEISADELDAFVGKWEERARLMRDKPGFIDSRMHRARSADSRFQLVNVSHWESQEAWEAATADPDFSARTRAAREGAEQPVTPNPAVYDVVVELTAP